MLDPTPNLGLYPGLAQVADQLRARAVYEGLPVAPARGDEALDLLVAPRVQRREREVLELPLEGIDPEPVGERGVDLERLRRLS